MSLVEQELLTIPEHLDSSQVISRVRVTPSLVFWVVFMCSFFLSDIVLLVLRFKASDYLFGIFWLLLWCLLITSLVSSDYFFGIFWLLLWYLLNTSLVSSDYLFGVFWLLLWYLLITSLVSSDYFFGIFWLLLWYLLITSLVSSNISYWTLTINPSNTNGCHVGTAYQTKRNTTETKQDKAETKRNETK